MADFRVVNHGTMWTITALTEPAIEWMDENVETPSWGGTPATGITGDWRPMRDLAAGIEAEGFELEVA